MQLLTSVAELPGCCSGRSASATRLVHEGTHAAVRSPIRATDVARGTGAVLLDVAREALRDARVPVRKAAFPSPAANSVAGGISCER